MRTCDIKDCEKKHKGRGYCQMHLRRVTTHGDPHVVKYAKRFTHGQSNTVEYRTWTRMTYRCTNPSSQDWANYGGRGIKICERWRKFENFYADMGDRPSNRHSLDRINTYGDYTPENCRWATQKTQQNNRGSNHLLVVDGTIKTMQEWAETAGINDGTFRDRIYSGMTPEQALTTPVNKNLRRPR